MLVFGIIIFLVIGVFIYLYQKDKNVRKVSLDRWVTIWVSTVILICIFYTVLPRKVFFDYNKLIAPEGAVWNVKNNTAKVYELKEEEVEMRKSFNETPGKVKNETKSFFKMQDEFVSMNIISTINDEYLSIFNYFEERDFKINSYDYKIIKTYTERISKMQSKALKILAKGFKGKKLEEYCNGNIQANKEFMLIVGMVGKQENSDGIRNFSLEHYLVTAKSPYEYFDKDNGFAFIDISDQ